MEVYCKAICQDSTYFALQRLCYHQGVQRLAADFIGTARKGLLHPDVIRAARVLFQAYEEPEGSVSSKNPAASIASLISIPASRISPGDSSPYCI